mmetsp:Transcript_38087/g.38440  ORF Transcript_38087/g.38440 Transcript_38087/m.38440 type:complete len:122 (-) Transcript_38087:774-1139(-)
MTSNNIKKGGIAILANKRSIRLNKLRRTKLSVAKDGFVDDGRNQLHQRQTLHDQQQQQLPDQRQQIPDQTNQQQRWDNVTEQSWISGNKLEMQAGILVCTLRATKISMSKFLMSGQEVAIL